MSVSSPAVLTPEQNEAALRRGTSTGCRCCRLRCPATGTVLRAVRFGGPQPCSIDKRALALHDPSSSKGPLEWAWTKPRWLSSAPRSHRSTSPQRFAHLLNLVDRHTLSWLFPAVSTDDVSSRNAHAAHRTVARGNGSVLVCPLPQAQGSRNPRLVPLSVEIRRSLTDALVPLAKPHRTFPQNGREP